MMCKTIKTQKTIIAILATALLMLIPLPAAAHSGGTDESGGHYDSSTGEYHYHHGYSAHEHVDGECVFDFDDNVDHDRDYSSSNSEKTKNARAEEKPLWGYILFGTLLFVLVVPGSITGIREGIQEIKKHPTRDNYIVMGMMILAVLAGFVAPLVIVIVFS